MRKKKSPKTVHFLAHGPEALMGCAMAQRRASDQALTLPEAGQSAGGIKRRRVIPAFSDLSPAIIPQSAQGADWTCGGIGAWHSRDLKAAVPELDPPAWLYGEPGLRNRLEFPKHA